MDGYSPILAALSALFEFAAAGFTFVGTGRKRILYPTGAIFLLLAGYQVFEIAVCFRPANLIFSRLAFFDITWLPPLGLLLVYQLAPVQMKWLKYICFLYFSSGLALVIWIFADPACITRSVCQVVTARYLHSSHFEIVYGIFYQSGLALIIFTAAAGMAWTDDTNLRKHLAYVQTGVLGFVFPALAVRVLSSEPEGLMPSVMCHFALILAFLLFAMILRERKLER